MSVAARQSGFSAVELLVTLFIAAAFLIIGHQLYSVIIQDSGAARQKTRASNVAYNYLRQYAASAPGACTESTPVNNETIDPRPEGLERAVVTVRYSCPQPAGTLDELTKVEVTVKYTADEEVRHAIYTTL